MPEGDRCAALGWRNNTHPVLNEMSLKEMAKWHYENNPGVPYCSNPQFGLAGLDNRDVLTDLPKLNNLDELL